MKTVKETSKKPARVGDGTAGPGRPKGSKNRVSKVVEAAIAAAGQTPLEFLLSVQRDESRPIYLRVDAAKAAAPYVHPKLAQVELTGKDGAAIEVNVTDNERARRIAFWLVKGLRK